MCPVCQGRMAIPVFILARDPESDGLRYHSVEPRWCFNCEPVRLRLQQRRASLAAVRSRTPDGSLHSTARSREAGRPEQSARLLRSSESRYP